MKLLSYHSQFIKFFKFEPRFIRTFKHAISFFFNFFLQQKRNFELEERDRIVIYTTSLQIVRTSHDKSIKVKKILQNHCVRYEERDLNKNKESQRELKYRLGVDQVDVPHLFFNGKHVGVS
jgi:glutaredoxin domain-containing cysteine-rich protein 1